MTSVPSHPFVPGDAGAPTVGIGDGVRVIYIMGYGHSGSTILNAMLAEAADVEGIGELASLSSSAWRENGNEVCACGTPVRECTFWETVGARWKTLTGEVDFSALVSLREYFGRWCARRAPHRWEPARDAGFADRGRSLGALYRSIRDVSGHPVIVDCSKSAGRVRFLSRVPGLDLRVIHLVRDCRAVAWSMRKRNGSVLRTAMAWRLHNRLCDEIRKALPPERTCLVRYEDLVFRTKETLRRIEACVDVDLRPLAGRLARSEPIRFRHEVGGNRVRRTRIARLKPDAAWIEKLPRPWQAVVWLLNRRMLRSYGYEQRYGEPRT